MNMIVHVHVYMYVYHQILDGVVVLTIMTTFSIVIVWLVSQTFNLVN